MVLEILLGLLVLGEGYVIWNLNRKTELLETWVETFTDKITEVRDTLDEIETVDRKTLISVAAFFKDVRLIDNFTYSPIT